MTSSRRLPRLLVRGRREHVGGSLLCASLRNTWAVPAPRSAGLHCCHPDRGLADGCAQGRRTRAVEVAVGSFRGVARLPEAWARPCSRAGRGAKVCGAGPLGGGRDKAALGATALLRRPVLPTLARPRLPGIGAARPRPLGRGH